MEQIIKTKNLNSVNLNDGMKDGEKYKKQGEGKHTTITAFIQKTHTKTSI